jgi:hypothetical protein
MSVSTPDNHIADMISWDRPNGLMFESPSVLSPRFGSNMLSFLMYQDILHNRVDLNQAVVLWDVVSGAFSPIIAIAAPNSDIFVLPTPIQRYPQGVRVRISKRNDDAKVFWDSTSCRLCYGP